MNFNYQLKRHTCETLIDVRVGMSNRDETPMRFACVNCGEPIYIIYPRKGGIEIKGAESLPFDGA